MPNELVSYSRAGDVFHYRWAAKRCLKMIYPKSTLKEIVIEGSRESRNGGEYVIDVSEYFQEDNKKEIVHYNQLKHSTTQLDTPFKLSDLKDTFEGFGLRFRELRSNSDYDSFSEIRFNIVTNRQIDQSFKSNVVSISKKGDVGKRFKSTLEKYTKLKGKELALFCSLIQFDDREGDYSIQKDELRIEIERVRAGTADYTQVEVLEAMVKDRVLPHSNGVISKEDVLLKFGVTSENQLYPAPGEWESCENIIVRKQDDNLTNLILESEKSIVLHASGGIGKSVFCQQFIRSIPSDSFGLAYDCFGAGSYRRRSKTRHRHQDALVQIANELASRGFCNPLIPSENITPESLMKGFLLRVQSTIEYLKETASKGARLYILIDAADNSEMAASEFNQSSFARDLLKEEFPKDCIVVFLCRTERIQLLSPSADIVKIELSGFDHNESLLNLREHFPDATVKEGQEFHRLAGGNPRIQAYALNQGLSSVSEVLDSFGISGGSVDEQIGVQLEAAVNKIKNELTPEYQTQVHSICVGLASLPPFIPIRILSMASRIEESVIRSFIADIGRSLWLTDSSVQFRDEPTETWFRRTFIASKDEIKSYIESLEPFASESSYISEVLPLLYLQAEEYNKLIQITLADELLPENNPIEARTIRIYRLKFALKAALKNQNYDDAIKLAIRAGEEVAGNERQQYLLQNNIDLLVKFQSEEKIQELAFKRVLRNRWSGSENIFTASLLSGIRHFHGESQNFLRSAVRWLDIFFQEQERHRELALEDIPRRNNEPEIENGDILELAVTYLNLFGVDSCVAFLKQFRPREWIFDILKQLASRLIDQGEVKTVEEMLNSSLDKPYFTIALTSELMNVGRIPDMKSMKTCLSLMQVSENRLNSTEKFGQNNQVTSSILYFLEACVSYNLPKENILTVLDQYVSIRADQSVYDSYLPTGRENYVRSLAIRVVLTNESKVELTSIIPENLISKSAKRKKLSEKESKKERERKNETERKIKEFKETIDQLLSLSVFRLATIIKQETSSDDFVEIHLLGECPSGDHRHDRFNTIPDQICSIWCSILIFDANATAGDLKGFYIEHLRGKKAFNIPLRLSLIRAYKRLSHLGFLDEDLEETTYDLINSNQLGDPDDLANRYIALSRAVLSTSVEDAEVYFEDAVNVVSRFGQELTDRWGAIVSVANKINSKNDNDALAYRFIRCAELVGEDIREKHWDRGGAIAICTRISKGVGISSLSRWRERDVGRFGWMLYSQIHELLESEVASSSVCWGLSKFFNSNQRANYDFVDIFLKDAKTNRERQYIIDDLTKIYSNEGASGNCWSNLCLQVENYGLSKPDLELIVNDRPTPKKPHYDQKSNSRHTIVRTWNDIFSDLNLLTEEGIIESFRRFEERRENRETFEAPESYWKELLNRLKEANLWRLIDILLMSTKIGRYELQNFISQIPKKWLSKVSFKRKWPDFIHQVGKKLAHDLLETYGLKYFIERLNLNSDLIKILKLGIFEGLANSADDLTSRHFFGFVELASEFANHDQIENLVDYSISRFEIHIPEDYGDGPWSRWLKPPENVYDSIATFIWTALGTPKSEIRWNAVHCVRTLIELDCNEVINSLISLINTQTVGAFSSSKYPFYYLHAQQYLLIAFARTSLENSDSLVKHSQVFSNISLSIEHVIIQYFSSRVAINIEKFFPGTYDLTTIEAVRSSCESPFPIQEEDFNYSTNSHFHINGLVESDTDFHFGWDFDRYWFEPLGKVFGVHGKQVEDIAAQVIVDIWGKPKTGFNNDPRVELWNQSYNRETWHDHGSYPKTDSFDFYLSYHSMMSAASKLLKTMPVIKCRDWHDDEWLDWLSDHLLTRTDGKWLSDHRDPLPIKRPLWISNNEPDWIDNITEDNFVNSIIQREINQLWLVVGGGWTESEGSKYETIHINSALVNKKTAQSLLNALSTCNDPYDYKLPNYSEGEMEYKSDHFRLTGWVYKGNSNEGLDKFDEYSGGVDYPYYSIGETFIDELKLKITDDGKNYFDETCTLPVLSCSSWSSEKPDRDDNADQAGSIIKASLNFLLNFCKKSDVNIIFEVQANRNKHYRYRDDEEEYRSAKHKIYILKEDGTLRSTEKDIKLR